MDTCQENAPEGKIRWRLIFQHIAVYAVIVAVVTVIFRTAFMLCLIPSESMEKTLDVGDIVIGTRYNARNISRYDVMVFVPPDEPDVYYIKRVIGLPGETVKVKNGSVYVNGRKLDSSFVNGDMNSDGDGTYKVPQGCYFMLGDNRNNSKDSRFWKRKYVPLKNFRCKAQYVIFPFEHAKKLVR